MTIELRRDGARPLRIGHRGAPALAPENTLRSLACAVEHPLDLVELDVISTGDGQLVLGHSYDLRELTHGAVRGSGRPRSLAELREVAPDLPTLDEALAFLTAKAPGVGVQIDVKEPVLKLGASYFDVLRKLEAPLEAAPGDALMEIMLGLGFLLAFALALDGKNAVLDLD